MDYEKKYNEALERARYVLHTVETAGCAMHKDLLTEIFPELSESEDIIRRKLIGGLKLMKHDGKEFFGSEPIDNCIAWLEKQKELMPPVNVDHCDASWDAYYQRGLNKGYELGLEAGRKEQKPNSTEDMPYVADEHFFEREPADSFKYKLAEYMTKCCTKKEGPYGYTYGISAESILKMAEEELLKRGVVQKPADWSKED